MRSSSSLHSYVNPVAGCLPILLQMPIGVALYRMLSCSSAMCAGRISAVELALPRSAAAAVERRASITASAATGLGRAPRILARRRRQRHGRRRRACAQWGRARRRSNHWHDLGSRSRTELVPLRPRTR